MKKIFLLMVLGTMLSCSNDDNKNLINTQQWRLTEYNQAFIIVDDFNPNDVVWTFNSSTKVLKVQNNVFAMYPGLIPSGNYDYSMINNVLSFNYNMQVYQSDFSLSENDTVLTLFFDLIPQAADDEVSYIFKKN